MLVNVGAFAALTINSRLDDVLGLPRGWSELVERPWTAFTVAFTSGHVLHVLVAVAVVFFAGGALERRMGSWHVVGVYALSGVGGSVAMASAASAASAGAGGPEVSLGASAAFLGLLGALAATADIAIERLNLSKVVVVVVGLNLLQPLAGVGEWTSSVAHVAGIAVGAVWGYAGGRATAVRRG